MATTTEILKGIEPIIKRLDQIGVKMRPYTRPVASKEILAMSATNNEIRIWPGTAKLEIYPDKRRKQAVLISEEKGRTISEKFERLDMGTYRFEPPVRDGHSYLRNALYSKWNMRWMNNHKIEYSNLKVELKYPQDKDNPLDNERKPWVITGTIKVTIPASRMQFLIGIDENAHFISELPKKCTSVAAAHEILRPKGVPKNALRQGEWFFVEPTDDEWNRLMNYLAVNDSSYYSVSRARANGNIGGTSHIASIVVNVPIGSGEMTFVTGIVKDSRKGRHEELIFDGWWKAIRNNEVINSRTQTQSRGYFD